MDNIEPINIKKLLSADVAALQKISRQTFSETYSAGNTGENMKKYLNATFAIPQLTAELNDNNSEFYFAQAGENIIGYIKLNKGAAQTELKDRNGLEIERIYVLKEFQGLKVGQALYEKALERAREEAVEYVWLGVWEENPKAMRFYEKNGFVAFDKHHFKLGDEEQTDIMMKLDLPNPATE
ncbi:MAG: N-acetyltransferase [Ferruginibacter sp.]|nr:N-acetyltransferase [Ferruginibacter sp.]